MGTLRIMIKLPNGNVLDKYVPIDVPDDLDNYVDYDPSHGMYTIVFPDTNEIILVHPTNLTLIYSSSKEDEVRNCENNHEME